MNPGNVDEIFNQIILPELRLARDPRVFEYWDMKIKKASEGVKDRPAFEQEKFNKEIYPGLLWARAQEYSLMGQPNRALGEMLKVLRTYPQHPNLGGWINQVEQLLEPTPAPTASPSPTPTGTSAKTQ